MANTILFYNGNDENLAKVANNGKYIKTFDWTSSKYAIDRCAAELLCRIYLKKGNFDGITTRTEQIQPANLEEYLDGLNNISIQTDFKNQLNNVKKFIIDKKINEVSILVEEATKIGAIKLNEIAGDDNQRKKFVKRLFEILSIIHESKLVHRDIKIDNLMYVTRFGTDTLVLNDWDASFFVGNELPEGLKKEDILPLMTLEYAAPEQVDDELDGVIGMHTDIWQAGIVSYYIYNNCNFPALYNEIDFKEDEKARQKNRIQMNEIFSILKENNYTFSSPQNADDNMKNIILSALNVFSAKRPPANEIYDNFDRYLPQNNQPEMSEINYESIKAELDRRKREKFYQTVRKFFSIVAVIAIAIIALKYTSETKKENPTVVTNTAPPVVESTMATTVQQIATTETDTPPPPPATEHTKAVSTVDKAISELDFTYDKWVENYRLGDGYYTGGIVILEGEKEDELYAHGENSIYIKDDGTEYRGNYYYGVMCDDDCYFKKKNGNEYQGSIRDNKMHGNGYYNVKTPERGWQGEYSGYFENDDFEGEGKFTYTNGEVFEGTFKKNELWNGTVTYPNGKKREIKNVEPN